MDKQEPVSASSSAAAALSSTTTTAFSSSSFCLIEGLRGNPLVRTVAFLSVRDSWHLLLLWKEFNARLREARPPLPAPLRFDPTAPGNGGAWRSFHFALEHFRIEALTTRLATRDDVHRILDCRSGAAGASLRSLTHLEESSDALGAERGLWLAEALKANNILQQLNLRGNSLGETGARALGEALKVNTTLKELLLRRNKVGADGASALGEALKVNTALLKLDLEDNSVRKDGASALGEALKVNATLKELIVRRNKVGYAGASVLGEAGSRCVFDDDDDDDDDEHDDGED